MKTETFKKGLEFALLDAEAAELAARKRKNSLQEKFDQLVLRPQLLALVGKTFKYPKNCYSCPEKPSDYWPVYAQVVKAGKGTLLETIQFETDSRGDFHYRKHLWIGEPGSGFVPCSKSEYLRAFKKQITKVVP